MLYVRITEGNGENFIMAEYIKPYYLWAKLTDKDVNTMSRKESYEFQPWDRLQKQEFINETGCKEDVNNIFWSNENSALYENWLEEKYCTLK